MFLYYCFIFKFFFIFNIPLSEFLVDIFQLFVMIIEFSFHWFVIVDCKLIFGKASLPKLFYLFYCYFILLAVCCGRIFS